MITVFIITQPLANLCFFGSFGLNIFLLTIVRKCKERQTVIQPFYFTIFRFIAITNLLIAISFYLIQPIYVLRDELFAFVIFSGPVQTLDGRTERFFLTLFFACCHTSQLSSSLIFVLRYLNICRGYQLCPKQFITMFVIVFLTIFIPSWVLICMMDTFEENRDFVRDQNIVEGYTNHANYSFYAFNMTPESRVMAGVELFTLVLVYCITIVSASLISNKVRSDGNCSTSNVAFRRTLSTVNAFTFIAVANFSFSALPFMVIYFCILFTIPIGTLAMACTISNIYVPVITPLILLSNVYELRKTMRRLLGCVRRGKGEMESSA